MSKKKHFNLWFLFVFSVFCIMLFSVIVMCFIILLLVHLGYNFYPRENPFYPIILLLLTSAFIGTLLSMMVGNIILKPIRSISNAIKLVATGDFTIRLDETQKIYEVNEMAKDFNVMVAELSSIETLRNDFIANVSHEFKTPLSTIEGYATLLQSDDLTPEQKLEYNKIIINSTRQLSNLSSNILKISKLENQELIVDKNYFPLDEQIRQALLLLENKWSVKNINLDINLTPITYYGNEELLLQVWLNLLGNAIKFTPCDGTIEINSFETDHDISVTITDNGIGMTLDVQKHIFEKFYQADKARYAEGNGLGLTLVKRIIDLCNGCIAIKSEPEIGTSFILKLPR